MKTQGSDQELQMQASPTEYKIQKRIPGAEDTIENIDTTVKKMQNAPNTKHAGNPEYNEKTKPKDKRYRIE